MVLSPSHNKAETISFLVITSLLAFCSVVYVLVMAQILSSFWGTTSLQYPLTIGLYTFALGMGFCLIKPSTPPMTCQTLQIVEIFLCLTGGFSVIFLLILGQSFSTHGLIISALIAAIIVCFGLFSGMRLSFFMFLGKSFLSNPQAKALSATAIGSALSAWIFAFLIYPTLGLLGSAIITAIINALCALYLSFRHCKDTQRSLTILQGIILLILFFYLFLQPRLTDLLLHRRGQTPDSLVRIDIFNAAAHKTEKF